MEDKKFKPIEEITEAELQELWPLIGGAPHLFEQGKDELKDGLSKGFFESLQMDYYTMAAIVDYLRSKGYEAGSPGPDQHPHQSLFDHYNDIKSQIGELGYNNFIHSKEVEEYREWLRNDRYRHRIEWFEKQFPNGLYYKEDDGTEAGIRIITKQFLAEADAAYELPSPDQSYIWRKAGELKSTLMSHLLQRKETNDEPYLHIGSKSYTRLQLVSEIDKETEVGMDILCNLIMLTLDRLSRGKEHYPYPDQSGKEAITDHEPEKEVMMQAFDKVRKIFEGRSWIMQGRGSYPYNDDRYKEEVRYMYDEFDTLYKDTWKNIKSKTFEYRNKIIEQYKKESGKEDAVAFGEWIINEHWETGINGKWWCAKKSEHNARYTTSQLYDIYQSKVK